MSDDAGNEYFSDGISEELLNVLVKVKGLRVPSRTSSFTFKGSDMRVAEIGKALNVDHVLEGSVRKAGNRIRVTAQLIDAHTDTHLWSETYTREVDDIFAVQDEIAQAIVGALKLTLSGSDEDSLAQHATDNVEAYNNYLLGRHQWYAETLAKQRRFDEALEQIRLAREADPLSAIIAMNAAAYLWYAGRPDDSLAAFQAARKLDPLLEPTLTVMEVVYAQTGDYANARLLAQEVGRIRKKEQSADLAMIDAMEHPALKGRAVEVIQNFQDLPDGAEYRALYLARMNLFP